ncbi:LPS export ABC transporter periplasmic protein LptC [Vibrio panuliri]|uniref:Lipopolysaccharide export system protein LptC n=1 Tax=Vibrio panuliri TaxID=1381081 RepID=A0A1Q9HC02_9VIBR|nr:LPS export ABC transporter periplasmic protein LptC [Vibrio panuliri]KAB1455458.1 LPS export ABC transporter periplasmic protein LptC [Vibrio panuliri]OLQ85431.1 LPS export ABC transporter periplasmic protein LptC [Vibrio panuliri]OLQ86921.1 LPS export ABC transporter periplasmic protein LptC [Vibrio panuliri]
MSLTRIGYLVLIAIIAASGYYLMRDQADYDIQVEPDVELPIFTGQGLVNTSFNAQGVRSYVITSARLNNYASNGDTIFEYPVLKVYQQGSTQEWEITADHGTLSKDHVLVLKSNVLAKNLLPDSGFDTLSTDTISIQLDNRDFWADNQVTLVGPQFETVGQAMKGNFAENTATLYKHVQGRYETLTP